MTLTAPVPAPREVRDLLRDLLARNVEVEAGGPYAPAPGERSTLAVYVDDALGTRAVALADLGFSAYAGAAIGLVPPSGAETAIEERMLSPMIAENLYEVLNICAVLLNAEGLARVKLHEVFAPGSVPPTDVAAYARTLGRRLDVVITIAGYGAGRLSLVLVD